MHNQFVPFSFKGTLAASLAVKFRHFLSAEHTAQCDLKKKIEDGEIPVKYLDH